MMNFMSNNRQGMCSFSQSSSSPSSASSSSSSHQRSSLPHVFSYGHGLWQQGAWLDEGCPSPTATADNDDEVTRRRDGGSTTCAAGVVIEREHMFDKAVTPSDVGKLNRLVIPKQQAEKYFPLDSSTSEKGLLLNFEDRNGKPWRFRYSYWNSSQSYVMTKGWSRFVKDKKLDAGDIVSFHRGVGELGRDRLFIDWRRRPNPHHDLQLTPVPGISHLPFDHFSFHRSIHQQYPAAAWNYHAMFLQPPPGGHSHSHSSYGYNNYAIGCGPNYPFNSQFNTAVVNGNPCSDGSVIYLRSGAEEVAPAPTHSQRGGGRGGGAVERGEVSATVFESAPVVQGKAAAKRLRLFGVNMDCPIPESDDCDILSSTSTSLHPSSSSALIPSSYHLLSSSYGDGPSDQESPIDKAKASSSMSLDLDIS